MINQKIAKALQATEELANNKSLPGAIHWKIFQLRKILHEHMDFYQERDTAIRDSYREFADENGTLTGEKADEFTREINDLNNMDKMIEFERFRIPSNKYEGITASIMEQLDELIDFEPEE